MIDHTKILQEIVLTAQRSRGPGGQHVNKTNSSIQLKWNYILSQALSEEQKALVAKKLESYINKVGEITLRHDTFRDQDSNKKEVIKKLFALLKDALKKPKKRISTKPTFSSKVRKKKQKQQKSEIKKGRSAKWY